MEQDLLLSRLICEVASYPKLGDELVFRGDTCWHKLHLPQSMRYSEDLDYVRAPHGPIAAIVAERLLRHVDRSAGPVA